VSQDSAPDTDTDTKVIADPITSPPHQGLLAHRYPSTRISKPVDRLNLMYVKRATKIFTEKAALAMEAEVTSLLGMQTIGGVHGGSLSGVQ
jgi:hypothetical protein